MENNLQQQLLILQKKLYDFSDRNPLMKVNVANLWWIEAGTNEIASKIFLKSKYFEKEYGLNTSLFVSVFLRWRRKENGEFIVSPLLWKPARINKKRREEIEFTFEIEEEKFTVNPLIRKIFSDDFDIILPELVDDEKSLLDILEGEFKSVVIRQELTEEIGWTILKKNAIGIFNYKKILAVRDYDRIIFNPSKSISDLILGNKNEIEISNDEKGVFGSILNDSQNKALIHSIRTYTVIQGPPGTGKSELVAAIIKEALIHNKKILFVSEKKSALQVVYDRLKKSGLESCIAFFDPSKDEKKEFYKSLQKSYEYFLSEQKVQVNEVKEYESSLIDFYFNNYSVPQSQSQKSALQIIERLLQLDFNVHKAIELEKTPDLEAWKKNELFIKNFHTNCKRLFKSNNFAHFPFSVLSASVFADIHSLSKLSEELNEIEILLKELQTFSESFDLEKNVHSILRFAIAGSILAMVDKNQLFLVHSDSKKYKSFSSLAKKYQLVKSKLKQAEKLNSGWKHKPSALEIIQLTESLKEAKKSKSILSVLKRNKTKSQKYFDEFSSELSNVTKLQMLDQLRNEWNLKSELEELEIKLKYDFSILDPDTEIDHILRVRAKISNTGSAEYSLILEHPDSQKFIKELDLLHRKLSRLISLLDRVFDKRVSRNITDLLLSVSRIKTSFDKLVGIEGELLTYFAIPYEIRSFLLSYDVDPSQIEAQILFHKLKEKYRYNKSFFELTGENLKLNVWKNYTDSKERTDRACKEILIGRHQRLEQIENLIQTPANKFKSQEKESRNYYKQARKNILHEIKKKKVFKSVNELMVDSAELVIEIQPVWMMNPLSVASYLPLKEHFFDYVIFDESSQIPLEDALPAVFRAEKIVVVGDSQQMPPGKFFSSADDSFSLLDQAEVSFRNVFLDIHYRSEHPALVQLSNHLFYGNKLKFFPPVSDLYPIEYVYCNGVFDNNVNVTEAKKIAKYYNQLLNGGITNVAIISFSLEQQKCIEREIEKLQLERNDELMIRNLENVQGVERDFVLVSVGYGKDKKGIFRKNLGPINSDSGARRLNVLFTRAIKKMIVFKSIDAHELSGLQNEGLKILGQFLNQIQPIDLLYKLDNLSASEKILHDILLKTEIDFKFYYAQKDYMVSCFILPQIKKVILLDSQFQKLNELDVKNTLQILRSKFDKVLLITTKELLYNRDEVLSKIIRFGRKD